MYLKVGFIPYTFILLDSDIAEIFKDNLALIRQSFELLLTLHSVKET